MAGLTLGAGMATAQSETDVVIAGSSLGGSWYALSTGIAEVLNRNSDLLQATSSVGASVENAHFVAQGEYEFAFTLTDIANYAYNGGREFEEAYPDLRAVLSGQTLPTHLIVAADSDITSYADLGGKRVAMGPPGGGTALVADAILEAAGVGTDFRPFYLSHSEGSAALRDGTVDGQIYTAGSGSPGIVELATTYDVRFVPVEDSLMEAVLSEHPYWSAGDIAAGTYGQEMDVPTVTARAVVLTRADVEDAVVSDFLTQFFEHHDDLVAVHSVANQWTLDGAMSGISLPLHPGAIAYYEAQGLEPPAALLP
ncbi:MAG: TAXI family TRAP transporter solute-binding subunit [Pseudomonadota bacterium]|nr:TAXI family TRAP transporter solute-binding subunit [Pseudomonadota bacterium]